MLITLFVIPLFGLIFINWISFLSNSLRLEEGSYAYATLTLKQKLRRTESLNRDTLFYCRIISSATKLVSLLSLHINLLYSFYLWKEFPKVIDDVIYLPSAMGFTDLIFFEANHSLNLPFIILTSGILIVALLASWYTEVNMFLFCSMLLLVEIFLLGAFSCTNIFIFLLFFESSAIPIFILISYCGSSRRERIKASYYFLFFTLYGSLSLLLLILNFYSLSQLSFMVDGTILPNQASNKTLWFLLFIAFAVKIPLFPFHIWLPYAHVEASTSTSILLAALMLKLGGYGILRFTLPIFSIEINLFFRPLIVWICVLGLIYGGFTSLRQIDLKRQIAFSSISHMSFATLGIFSFSNVGFTGSIYLMLSHGLTSAALFFLVGILSERYHTRSIMVFSGLLSSMPLFSFFLLFISLANIGFPMTSGFIPEIMILISIVSSNPAILLPTLLGMLLTTASSLIVIFRLLFGHPKLIYFRSGWADLTKLEFSVLSILSFWILYLGLNVVL